MKKKVVLEFTNSFEYAYIPESDERVKYSTIDIGNSVNSENDNYDYTTEFACMVVAMIDFNDTYSILVKNFLEQDKDHDTLVIKCGIMQYLKNINTKTNRKFINHISLAYKNIKIAGHRKPDEIYYQSDKGAIDNFCIHQLWEPAHGEVKECTYEFSNLVGSTN